MKRCGNCIHHYYLNGFKCRLEHFEFNIAWGGCDDWEQTRPKREPTHKHPGVVVQERLAELNIRPRTFARQIGVKNKEFEDFLYGKRFLDREFAEKIETELGLSSGELIQNDL